MIRLYVPACGDRIVLEKEWRFDLSLEYRNMKYAQAEKLFEPGPTERYVWSQYEDRVAPGERPRLKTVPHSLPAGTVLEFDRVYIRTFNKSRVREDEDYDSVTFKVVLPNGKAKRHGRFWVKRSACLDIEYSMEQDGLYRDRVKAVRAILES